MQIRPPAVVDDADSAQDAAPDAARRPRRPSAGGGKPRVAPTSSQLEAAQDFARIGRSHGLRLLKSRVHLGLFADRRRREPADAEWVCISFSLRAPRGLHKPFGQSFFRKYAIDALYVVPRGDHRYLSPALAPIARFARVCARDRMRLNYGSSMGAVGALLASRDSAAHRVLAISPRIGWTESMTMPIEQRQQQRAALLQQLRQAAQAQLGDCEVLLAYDPYCDGDRQQAELFHALAPGRVHLLRIAFGGHPVGPALVSAGLLRTLVQQMMTERSVADIAAQARAAYRASDARKQRVVSGFLRRSLRTGRHRALADRLAAHHLSAQQYAQQTAGRPSAARTTAEDDSAD